MGKTCLLSQYVNKNMPLNSAPTVGVEFATKNVQLQDGGIVKAQIWDTAGQERYKAICGAHYKRALGALLVYDITSRETFDQLQDSWIDDLEARSSPDIQVILVGNKKDLVRAQPDLREVTEAEGRALA